MDIVANASCCPFVSRKVRGKICRLYLASAGFDPRVEIIWDDITLQDEVEQSRAALYRAQAKKIEKETR